MTDDSIRLEQRPATAGNAPVLEAEAFFTAIERSAVPETLEPTGPLEADEVHLAVLGDLSDVASFWHAFEKTADHTFFQTFEWLDAWQRHVGARRGVVPAIVTGRHPDGTLLFILPLAVQRRNTIRQLTFLGSDLCDYNAPLLHRRFGALIDDAAFAALWRRITGLLRADRRFGFDVVDLPKMPERVGEQRNPLLVLGSKPNPSGAYLTALGGTWDDFYARKRSPATRKKERKQLRQLGEFGEIRFVDRLDGEERAKTLDLLFEQKARSFARMGVRNIFVRPGYQDLFRAFATEPQSRHLVHLSRLEVGDTVAAASIGFTACDCYYLVLSSYDGGAMARFGPGRTHLHELLRFAIGGDFRCFDFTIGDELYKRDWSDARLVLQDHLSAASWRGRVVVSLITGFRAMKRAVKQNPLLWRLFSQARSRLGAMRAAGSPTVQGGHEPAANGDADA